MNNSPASNAGEEHGHCKSSGTPLLPVTADQNKMDCQMQNTHSEEHPATRRNVCGVDYFCQVHTETQQGKASVLSIRCPLNPLMNAGTHISLTSAPPLSSDSQAKPAIGLKSAKHDPAVLLIVWATCRRETTARDKRRRRTPRASVRLRLLSCEDAAVVQQSAGLTLSNCCRQTLRSAISAERKVANDHQKKGKHIWAA